MKKPSVLAVMLVALTTLPALAQVTLTEVQEAATAEAFLALGGREMTATEFRQRVVGRELDEGTWL